MLGRVTKLLSLSFRCGRIISVISLGMLSFRKSILSHNECQMLQKDSV